MKIISFLSVLVLFSFQTKAQSEKTVSLTLEFEATEHNKGGILCALYNSAENHMEEEKTFRASSDKFKDSKVKLVMKDLPQGFYSFSYYHDVNDDGKLNTNFVGIPKEPYGFSNGEKGRLGPPSFDDSKFKIQNDTVIKIEIK